MAASPYTFRPVTEADFPLLADWLAAPHVAQWWGDPEQGLRATVSYPAFQDLDAIREAVEAQGLSLEDTSTVEDGGRVVSEVIVGGAA